MYEEWLHARDSRATDSVLMPSQSAMNSSPALGMGAAPPTDAAARSAGTPHATRRALAAWARAHGGDGGTAVRNARPLLALAAAMAAASNRRCAMLPRSASGRLRAEAGQKGRR